MLLLFFFFFFNHLKELKESSIFVIPTLFQAKQANKGKYQ